MSIKTPATFWGGVALLVVGALLFYGGYYIDDTNLQTFVYKETLSGLLIFLGIFGGGIGLLMIGIGLFVKLKR